MERIYGLPGRALDSVAYAVGIDMMCMRFRVSYSMSMDTLVETFQSKISDDVFRHGEMTSIVG